MPILKIAVVDAACGAELNFNYILTSCKCQNLNSSHSSSPQCAEDEDKDIDKDYDLLELIGAAVDGLPEFEKQLTKDVKHIFTQVRGSMEFATCDLVTASSTKEEVLEAAEHANYVFSQLSTTHVIPKRKAAFQQLAKNIRVLEKAVKMLGDMKGGTKEEEERITERLNSAALRCLDLTELLLQHNDQLDQDLSRILQASLLDLVKGQTKEVKEWYFQEVMTGFAEHVSTRVEAKPVVEVEEKKSTSFSWPPEIATLIYSACDLETCVVLREVNSEWYNLFQQMGPLFKRKLHLRNPWFGPGDSLNTWADCVLVFVARLQWPTTTDLDGLDVPQKKEDKQTVVASELGYKERLPAEFSAMQPHHATCSQVVCDHVHAFSSNLMHHFLRNLHSMETFDGDMQSKIVRQEGEATVLEFGGVEYTVATDMVPTSGPSLDLSITPGALVVNNLQQGQGPRLIMTRDKPHYKDGFEFHDDNADIGAMGDLLFARYGDQHHFADHESKQMIKYPLSVKSFIAGSYNGLVWWHIQEKILVPTFVDLETQQVHYNPTKILTGVSDNEFSQSSKAPHGRHFIFAGCGNSAEMVNLETGTITQITTPLGQHHKRLPMIPGFMDGTFRAYYMSKKAHKKSRHKLMKDWNIARDIW